MLSTIGDIASDLLIGVGALTGLLIVVLIVVVKMPAGNPLKRLLTALCLRLGATAAAGAAAIAGRIMSGPSARRGTQIIHDGR